MGGQRSAAAAADPAAAGRPSDLSSSQPLATVVVRPGERDCGLAAATIRVDVELAAVALANEGSAAGPERRGAAAAGAAGCAAASALARLCSRCCCRSNELRVRHRRLDWAREPLAPP